MGTATRQCRWCGTERRHRRVVRSQTVELTCLGCGKTDMEQKVAAVVRAKMRPPRQFSKQQSREAQNAVRKNERKFKKQAKRGFSAGDRKAYGKLMAEMVALDRECVRRISDGR